MASRVPFWQAATSTAWPRLLALGWLCALVLLSVISVWVSPPMHWRLSQFADMGGLSPAEQPWLWWLVATRNSVLALLAVVGLSLGAGVPLAVLAALGPWWASAGLTRLLELTGALPNILLVGLWLVSHPHGTLLSVVVVVAVQRAVETASFAWFTLDSAHTTLLSAPPVRTSPTSRALRRQFAPTLRSVLATSAAHTAASLFALQAAVVFLGLAVADDATWASLLGRTALDLGQDGLGWAQTLAALSTCTATLSLFAVAASPPSLARLTPVASARVEPNPKP